jgi:hypothetical protein
MIRSLVLNAGPAEGVGDPAAAVGWWACIRAAEATSRRAVTIRVTFGPGTVRAAVGGWHLWRYRRYTRAPECSTDGA